MLRHVRLRAILSGFPCEDLGLSSPGIYVSTSIHYHDHWQPAQSMPATTLVSQSLPCEDFGVSSSYRRLAVYSCRRLVGRVLYLRSLRRRVLVLPPTLS